METGIRRLFRRVCHAIYRECRGANSRDLGPGPTGRTAGHCSLWRWRDALGPLSDGASRRPDHFARHHPGAGFHARFRRCGAHRYPYGFANDNADGAPDFHHDSGPVRHAVAKSYACPDNDADAIADPNPVTAAHARPRPDRFFDERPDGYGDTHGNGDPVPYAHTHAVTNADSGPYCDAHPGADGDPHPGAAATTSAATYIHANPRATHRDSNTHAAAAYADPNSGAAPATVQSNIIDFVLQDLAIKAGDTVLWTNQGAATHTTTSGSDGGFDGQGWNSPFLSTDESFSHTFTSAGSFPYTCTIHPFMNATVTVTD